MAAIEDAAPKKRGQYQSYPSSTRTKVVQAAMEGNPWRDVARALGVKMSTARSWVKSGRTACLPRGGKVVEPKRKISEEYGDFIFEVFRRSPTTTFAEVGRLLRRRFNLQIDPTNISRYMKKEEKFKEFLTVLIVRPSSGVILSVTESEREGYHSEILKLRQMRPRGGASRMTKPAASIGPYPILWAIRPITCDLATSDKQHSIAEDAEEQKIIEMKHPGKARSLRLHQSSRDDRTMYNREREGPFVVATDCVSSRTAGAEAAQQWNIASNVEEFDHCAAVA
ncbi:hypothetical protein FOZ60_009332 [Perkinsus olseni]|uniref:Uncharacterized protein n=1 Tax=Perkinsus olseni TaxID=32597 RepID=A0A7J6NIR9_PEROL|nr:hypothetical protein FOZ60_009332 [Perkinsus olseni]